MEEIWRSITNYEGYYEISNLGRVKSLPRLIKSRNPFISKEKIIIPFLNTKGYLVISLCKEGVCKSYLLHRLVAESFIPNPENKPEVNHINGIKSDYTIDNLEWVTKSENHIHAHKTNLKKSNLKIKYGDLNGNSKLTLEQVNEIKIKFKSGMSRKELSKQYGISITTISSINTGRTWISENLK